MTSEEVKKIEQASIRMENAASLMAEIEAMKAENRERELEGKVPAHGYRQFMDAIERWHFDNY